MGEIHDRYIDQYEKAISQNPENEMVVKRSVWISSQWEKEAFVGITLEPGLISRALDDIERLGEAELAQEIRAGIEIRMKAMEAQDPKDIMAIMYQKRESESDG